MNTYVCVIFVDLQLIDIFNFPLIKFMTLPD